MRVVQGADGGHDEEVEALEEEGLAVLAPQHGEGDEVQVPLQHQHQVRRLRGALGQRGQRVLHGGHQAVVQRRQGGLAARPLLEGERERSLGFKTNQNTQRLKRTLFNQD